MKKVSERVVLTGNRLKFSYVDLVNSQGQKIENFESISVIDASYRLLTTIPILKTKNIDDPRRILLKVYKRPQLEKLILEFPNCKYH